MVLAWLLTAAIGPAAFALPVNWAGDALAGAAQSWFKRLVGKDDLSRLVRAATGSSVGLTPAEFGAVRKLLADQQTWSNVIGRGTVDDLAGRIADCLPPRDGRTAGDAHAAALTIARGLLEFAVADLDPKMFQQVLLARLERMERGDASALDEAMLGLHARFDSVMEQLKLVLDRLPPGPAHRGEIEVYLRTLIAWLNTDPWLRDLRGSVPTPATIERKLRVTDTGRADEQDLDADALAQQCRRLVILGGPGSGKTWLAKRTARRCAEDALQTLEAGGNIDEAEFPLYTTCSRLFSANGNIREAAVSSALDQLPDLGGSRISAALRLFFTERNAPTVLIIDSLDEAHGSRDRLRQASNLPWRIVLTSRPSSWNQQLVIEVGHDSHRVGELQPLRYPGDVVSFIQRWFDGGPAENDLATQIAGRPDLQQAATVPLILVFYCIVGGSGPLPEFRSDLYAKVVRRLLTGRWRDDDDDRRPDPDRCLPVLRAWAWSGASGADDNDPVSGVGTWTDDIPTERVQLGEADEDALDHVATPLGRPDPETGKIFRRFIHRSIREHLVAEHVASLPIDEAVKILLPHLWYDPVWEYAAPTAIAKHRQRDQLLQDLICRAARSDQIPGDLSVIDAGWEFRRLLARVASESGETDWSPEIAGIIGHARVELARSARTDDLGRARWGTSNRQACDALLGLLAGQSDHRMAAKLAEGVARLASTAEDKRQARDALLRLLVRLQADQLYGYAPELLVGGVVRLAPTAEDKRQARDALLGLLVRLQAGPASGTVAAELVGGVARLAPTAEDKRQAREALLGLLAGQTDGRVAAELAEGVARLDPTAEDKRQARDALLGLLAGQTNGWLAERLAGGVARLDPTAEDKRQARDALLRQLADLVAEQRAREVARLAPTAEDKRQARDALLRLSGQLQDTEQAAELAEGVARLDPTAADKRQARDALLRLLAAQSYPHAPELLVGGVVRLAPTAEDKRQARDALLGLLVRLQAGPASGTVAAELVGGVARLAPTAEDKRQAREALLGLLAAQTDGRVAAELAEGVARLDPTAEDKRQAREALLRLLAGQTDGWLAERLAEGVARLDPTAEDKRQAREALLRLLAGQTDGWLAERLAEGVARLDPTAEDKRQARDALLGLLPGQTNGRVAAELAEGVARLDPTAEDKRQAREALLRQLADLVAERLAEGVARLDPTAEDKRQAREALLRQLADFVAERLAEGVARLDPTAEDKRQARDALLRLLAGESYPHAPERLAERVARLDPTAEDKRQAREALLGLLAGQTDGQVAERLAERVARLDPTAEDKRQAREALLGLLAGQTDGQVAERLAERVARLDPTAEDKRQAREALLRLVRLQAGPASGTVAAELVGGVARLDPTVRDLTTWRATVELLAAVRQKSALAVWLTALPSLTSLSGAPP